MEVFVGKKFLLGRMIASKSSIEIYSGTDILTNEEVTIKLENVETERHLLKKELEMYHILAGGIGIPNVKWNGVKGDYYVLVIDLLGPSLEQLSNNCGRKFSLKTVLMLADQMIRRLEFLHTKSFVHENITPENFHIGLHKKSTQVYITGFGQSEVFTYRGVEYSRKEDMVSLGYTFMYFLEGSLPWQDLEAKIKEEKFGSELEKKALELCRGYPIEFSWYFSHCHSLAFEDGPDYDYLRRIFRELFMREGYEFDDEFDWSKKSALEGWDFAYPKVHLQSLQQGEKSYLSKADDIDGFDDSEEELVLGEASDFHDLEDELLEADKHSAKDGLKLPPLPEKYKYQHEHKSEQGIEYIRVKTKSPFAVMQTHEYKNQLGAEYIRPKVKSPFIAVQTREIEIRQGTEHIREKSKSPFVAVQTQVYEHGQGQQGTEYIREKKKSPFAVMQTHEYVNGQGMEHIRPPSRSPYSVPENYEYKK